MRSKQDKMIHKHMVTLAVGRFIVIAPNVQFFLLSSSSVRMLCKISGSIWLEKCRLRRLFLLCSLLETGPA